MKNKTFDEILELFAGFRENLKIKPSVDTMYEEVKMMRFKIKPLQGDVTLLDLNNQQLIETLWQLGKLDEFFQQEFKKLPLSQQEIFFNFFTDMYNKLQNNLNHINLKAGKIFSSTSSVLEMEIIKEKPDIKKIN